VIQLHWYALSPSLSTVLPLARTSQRKKRSPWWFSKSSYNNIIQKILLVFHINTIYIFIMFVFFSKWQSSWWIVKINRSSKLLLEFIEGDFLNFRHSLLFIIIFIINFLFKKKKRVVFLFLLKMYKQSVWLKSIQSHNLM
jgi:hypothetical protein